MQNEAGEAFDLEKLSLNHVESVTVEHENQVQVSINKVMSYLKHVFPSVKEVALTNCIACELHVTLTQQPTNITYMRQHITTLELISADYFIFPRLVYPCPNLESLHIEKPTNDVFNIDAQNLPLLYGNTVPFINLKHLKLSRISLTNLSHFLSRSSNLKKVKVSSFKIMPQFQRIDFNTLIRWQISVVERGPVGLTNVYSRFWIPNQCLTWKNFTSRACLKKVSLPRAPTAIFS